MKCLYDSTCKTYSFNWATHECSFSNKNTPQLTEAMFERNPTSILVFEGEIDFHTGIENSLKLLTLSISEILSLYTVLAVC